MSAADPRGNAAKEHVAVQLRSAADPGQLQMEPANGELELGVAA
jgi:hypothetical protein